VKAPESTNLRPMSYGEAMKLYWEDRRPFSFVAAPYGVLKTITVQGGHVVASPPDAARAHYDWLAVNRRGRK
jgi:hypothetical protein